MMRIRCALALAALVLGAGCQAGPRPFARAMRARAEAHEPPVTATLQVLAAEVGGRLAGLEHRLKTIPSIEGKIVREIAAHPDESPGTVELQDTLRYTLLVEDEPPGHHDEAIRTVLRQLERAGFAVEGVKNYWPRGDSYSGTNTVLRAGDGFPWELQFHTAASYAAKRSTHTDYETMRKPGTPELEKRRLFERMSRLWDDIAIPQGILRPHSLHVRERLVVIPAP
ncbi:MAG: hypothetical protein ACC662_10150 [Planctomycetota bacterium]